MRKRHEKDAKMTKHGAKNKIDTQMTQQGRNNQKGQKHDATLTQQ